MTGSDLLTELGPFHADEQDRELAVVRGDMLSVTCHAPRSVGHTNFRWDRVDSRTDGHPRPVKLNHRITMTTDGEGRGGEGWGGVGRGGGVG